MKKGKNESVAVLLRRLRCCCGLLTRVLLLLSLEPCDERDPRLAAASTAAAAAAVTAALVEAEATVALRCASVGGFELDLFDDLEELAELMAELLEETSEARGMCQ